MNPVRDSPHSRSFRGAEVRQEVMSAPSGSVSTSVKNFVTNCFKLTTNIHKRKQENDEYILWSWKDTTVNSSPTHTAWFHDTLVVIVCFCFTSWSELWVWGAAAVRKQEANRRGSRRNMWPESWALTQKHRRASSARAGSAWAKWKRTSRKMSGKLLTCRRKMTWRVWISSWKNWGGNLFQPSGFSCSHSHCVITLTDSLWITDIFRSETFKINLFLFIRIFIL